MRLVALVVLLASQAVPLLAEAALTTADVVRFVRAGISERTILAELSSRGFGEPLDAKGEASLREAGASESLVVAVRRAAPAPSSIPPAPVGPDATRGVLAGPEAIRGPTFAAGTRTVRVPVSVLDRDGRPVLGLQGADFRVLEDGKPQAVTLFSGERRPLRIALALDTSGSMQARIDEVRSALRHFIELLEPADEIMVLAFSDRPHTLQDFTSDRERLWEVLEGIEPMGGTALYDAAFEAIRRVARGPAESKAVVLVSDGVDTSSLVSFTRLREYARRSEVPIFSIALGGGAPVSMVLSPGRGGSGVPRGWPGGRGGWPGGPGTPGTGGRGYPGGGGGGWNGGVPRGIKAAKEFDPGPLLELADETGGRAEILTERPHYVPDSEEPQGRLKGAVESIAMTLRYRYLLGYEPTRDDRGWRSIKIEVRRPAAQARARKGYYSGA
jgi:VWFA-related protein